MTDSTPRVPASGRSREHRYQNTGTIVRSGQIKSGPVVVSLPTVGQIRSLMDAICPMCPGNPNRASAMYLEMVALFRNQNGQGEPYDMAEAMGLPGKARQQEDKRLAQQLHTQIQNKGDRMDGPPVRIKPKMIEKGLQALHAIFGQKLPAEEAAKRLEFCDVGGVRCAKCNEWAYFDPTARRFECRDDPVLGYNGKGCGWSITIDQARAVGKPCPYRIQKGEKKFCAKCGCPKYALAELGAKSQMVNAPCPRRVRDETGQEAALGAWHVSTGQPGAGDVERSDG